MVSLQAVKILVLCGLFTLTVILGLLPLAIAKYVRMRTSRGVSFNSETKFKRTISILSCFAAGVFLATCLLGLLPDVRKDLKNALHALNIETDFPVAEFVMVFGLFIILVIEQIVLSIKEGSLGSSVKTKKHIIHKPLLSEETDDEYQINRTDHTHHQHHDEFTRSLSNSSQHSISGISDQPLLSQEYHTPMHEDFEHQHSALRSVLLLLAISLHSLFEGLAVGLQRSTEQVLGIFVALLLHKGILSFSLGMNLIQSRLSNCAMIRSLVIFSLSAPVGIVIGIGIIDLWDSEISVLVQGILQGIACGTFLYITFFEVLPHEFNSCDIRLVKVIFLIIGFGTVTGTVFLRLKYG